MDYRELEKGLKVFLGILLTVYTIGSWVVIEMILWGLGKVFG